MRNVFLAFFGISLSASLLILALILLSSFLGRRYASKWIYWIWLVLAFRLILPFGGDFARDGFRMSGTIAAPEAEKTDTNDQPQPWRRIVVEVPAQMTAPVPVGPTESGAGITWLDLAAFIWMLGGLAFLAAHLTSYLHYRRRIMEKGTLIRDGEILCRMEELKQELRIKGRVRAVRFPEAGSPMIIGCFRPVLVLPEEAYLSEELSFILKHELVHCKRKDVAAKLLFTVANAVHWFNPLVWRMRREAVVDMELSCDERVTQGADYAARKAYTEALLSTLHRNTVKGTALSTQFYGGTEIMKKRFQNVLGKGGRKNGAGILAAAVVLAIGSGALIGCSASHEEGEGGQDAAGSEGFPEEEFHGYISGFDGTSVTIDRQLWVTSEDEEWKPEYNEAAGFEVVDAEGMDATYPLAEDCTYSVLENHYDPVVELDRKEFESYLAEMEYPVLWIIRLQDGQVRDIREQYRP